MENKKWWQSKTLWIAFLQAALGLLIAFASEFPEVGWLIVAKSGIDGLLRIITTKPIE